MDDRTPVVVGVAQLSLRDVEPSAVPEPAVLLERIARTAADDAGPGARLLGELDTCALVEAMGWKARNAPRLVAERIGARPRTEILSATGGDMGLGVLNHVAGRVARGESRVALVAGCHLFRTLSEAYTSKRALGWKTGGEGEPQTLGENRWGGSPREQQYGLRLPVDVYPLFENALRARRGLDPEAHQQNLGRLMSRFTDVAAQNPHAWFPVRRSAEELVRVAPDNRLIAWPYPKYLNAVMAVDQAAGCLVLSAAAARELGVPRERWVWWWGGAKLAEDAWFPSERRDFHESPALAATARGALASAGIGAGALDFFDFYSCFPVAVEFACEALGLSEDDPRGFTVTGGLPYAGGPGSNYTLHAVAAMCERLRARPGAKGMVTGNGWYFTKHSACVLASAPPAAAAAPVTAPALPGPVALVDHADGAAQIETYTVTYDREGAPARGIVVGRLLDGGARFLANTPDDRALLETLVTREGVGLRGAVRCVEGANRFVPA